MHSLSLGIRTLLALSVAILLAGCATTTNNYYTSTVNGWRGSNVKALTQKWGMPNEKIQGPHGDTVYIYRTEGYRANVGQASPAVGVNFNGAGRPVIVTATPTLNSPGSRGLVLICTTIFMADAKGTITGAETRGSGCYGGESFAHSKGVN